MRKVELLAPAGSLEKAKIALMYGADAVYVGGKQFSLRARASNFTNDDIKELCEFARGLNKKVYVTMNIIPHDEDLIKLEEYLKHLETSGVSAIITSSLYIIKTAERVAPKLERHVSTQMSITNSSAVKHWEQMGVSRVVLARECTLCEISQIASNSPLELEVFIHGALCISYSGQCLLSSAIGGRSGNRGLCAQPCRLPYEVIEENESKRTTLDKGYVLSPRDNCAIELLPELIKLGIDSFKIEGRMKTPYYVGVVTRVYRKYIDLVLNNISLDNETLRSMIKKNYDALELTIIMVKDDLIRTSNVFAPSEAPDVYEPDPFIED